MATTNKPIKFKPLVEEAAASIAWEELYNNPMPTPNKSPVTYYHYQVCVYSKKRKDDNYSLITTKSFSLSSTAIEFFDVQRGSYKNYHAESENGCGEFHRFVWFVLYRMGIGDAGPSTEVVEQAFDMYEEQVVKEKKYINGPKSNKEFLAKVGKQYNHA